MLNDRNRIKIVSAPGIEKSFRNLGEANKDFDQIVDQKERAEAYRDLCRILDEIIQKEKQDNLKSVDEHLKQFSTQQNHIEGLERVLKSRNEQLLNAKEILNQSSEKNNELTDSIQVMNEEIIQLKQQISESKTKITQLTEENSELKNTSQLLEQQLEQLNQKIKNTEKLYENIDFKAIIDKVSQLGDESEENQDCNKTLEDIVNKLNEVKPIVARAQNFLRNSNMQVEAKDVIAGIPAFNGDPKQLDGLINAAGLYYNLVEENQRASVLKIIKAKVCGEGLFKAGPFGEDINTWDLMKKRLTEKIKKPVTLEYAQEDLHQVFQKKGESVEDYGARIKTKLKRLNEASKLLTNSDDSFKVVKQMNEKQAINKFEQNIRDPTIKVLVSAASKLTLDECVTFAMQKELIEKSKNVRACTICGLTNHDESSCRKKNNTESETGTNRKKFGGNGGNSPQNKKFYKSGQNFDRNRSSGSSGSSGSTGPSKNEQKPSSSGNFSGTSRNRNYSYQYPKNSSSNEKSGENQKNVKTVNEDESNDLKTVKEVLEKSHNSKN